MVVSSTGDLSAERVQHWVDGYGAFGPLVFIVVGAGLTVMLFPGPLLAGASGLLFGTALGTPVSIVAATLGATLAFCLARWLAHDAVEQLAPPRVQHIRAWLGRRGFFAVLYARIAPGLPYTLVNYAAGLTPIRLAAFVAATAIGVTPRAFAYTALGGSLDDLSAPRSRSRSRSSSSWPSWASCGAARSPPRKFGDRRLICAAGSSRDLRDVQPDLGGDLGQPVAVVSRPSHSRVQVLAGEEDPERRTMLGRVRRSEPRLQWVPGFEEPAIAVARSAAPALQQRFDPHGHLPAAGEQRAVVTPPPVDGSRHRPAVTGLSAT